MAGEPRQFFVRVQPGDLAVRHFGEDRFAAGGGVRRAGRADARGNAQHVRSLESLDEERLALLQHDEVRRLTRALDHRGHLGARDLAQFDVA